MTSGSIQCTQEKTLFYSESKLGDLNANWIPILSVSILADGLATKNTTGKLLGDLCQ